MQGTIRVILGLVVLMGVAGGIDVASDAELLILIAFAVIGGLLMASGVKAMNT